MKKLPLFKSFSFVMPSGEIIHAKKVFSLTSSKRSYNIYKNGYRIGKVHGMYAYDKKTGEYGTAFYSKYYDKHFVAYINDDNVNENGREFSVSVMYQGFPFSISSLKRCPLTPQQHPIAYIKVNSTNEGFSYDVFMSKMMPSELDVSEGQIQAMVLLEYILNSGLISRDEYIASVKEEKMDNEYFLKSVNEECRHCATAI